MKVPDIFRQLMNLFDWVTIDWDRLYIPAKCIAPDDPAPFRIALSSLIPLALIGLVVLFKLGKQCYISRCAQAGAEELKGMPSRSAQLASIISAGTLRALPCVPPLSPARCPRSLAAPTPARCPRCLAAPTALPNGLWQARALGMPHTPAILPLPSSEDRCRPALPSLSRLRATRCSASLL